MVAKTTPMIDEEPALTSKQIRTAEYYQSPEGIAKLDAANKKSANIQALTQQILGQNLTSKWTGQGWGSVEKNAEAMAKMLAEAGIADIKQFGKIDKLEPVGVVGYTHNGNTVQNPKQGVYYEQVYVADPDGGGSFQRRDLSPEEVKQVKPVYGIEEYDSEGMRSVRQPTSVVEKDGKMMGVYGTTFGNKATGQAIESGYGRWQNQGGENLFGGTGEGKGNTGYRVNFADDGTPIFYTTQGTSNDLAQLMQDLGPIGQIALGVATGGMSLPAQLATNFAFQVLSGTDLQDAIKNTAVSLAVSQIPSTDFMKEVNLEIKKLGLDPSITKTLTTAANTAATSATRAALTGKSILDSALAGAASGGVNGAVGEIMKGIPDFDKLTPAQQKMAFNAVTGVISGKPLDQIVINSAIAAANAEIAEQKKYAPLSDEDLKYLTPEQRAVYDETGSKGLTEYNRAQKAAATNPDADVDALAKSGLTSTDTVNITDAKDAESVMDSIFKNATPNSDSGLSNQDIDDLINGRPKKDDTVTVTTPRGDDGYTDAERESKRIQDLIAAGGDPNEGNITITAPRPRPDETVFDPTYGGQYKPTVRDPNEILITGNRPAPKSPLDLTTDPVSLITNPVTTPTLPPAATTPPTSGPTPSAPTINIDPVQALQEFYNPFKPTPAPSAPSQTDTGPIQLMTDVFGTNIATAQKAAARGYGFSAGGDIDELLRLLRS
jgi:hypothetical protein